MTFIMCRMKVDSITKTLAPCVYLKLGNVVGDFGTVVSLGCEMTIVLKTSSKQRRLPKAVFIFTTRDGI